MKSKYIDLIRQTFQFPQEGFEVIEGKLYWQGICLMDIIQQYGTPVKMTFLPRIGEKIAWARELFATGIAKAQYEGDYHYCYCTKSSHFSFVLEEILKNGSGIETSSAFDLNIVEKLFASGKLKKDIHLICNGFKPEAYLDGIVRLVENGFENLVVVLDNKNELDLLLKRTDSKLKLGIRIASEEEPLHEFYTSRLGMRYKDIVRFYQEKIQNQEQVELKMLHFFINDGITDTAYYWDELLKSIHVYCALKKLCPELDSLDIGGGFPIQDSLAFDYDYAYMANEIVAQIKENCNAKGVKEPHIFTEFGSFTVGESGAIVFSVLDQKQQNDKEKWAMIDSSFMTTMPDTWALKKRYLMLAVNNWEAPYDRVLLGGLTCDSDDFYNSEAHSKLIYLPQFEEERPQYIGFFNTGAYQESLGGFGGIQHCLLPAPKHIIVDRDAEGKIQTKLFAEEQSHQAMLKILGY